MNWDDTRIFLAIHRQGTLRRAAKVAQIDQATAGRRLAAMEHALGATLFLRTSTGYVLTPAGEKALRSAEKIEEYVNELVRQAHGVDGRLAGEVKVTTTDSLALDFVIPAIAQLHAEHPEVRIMLNTSTQMLNLARREADIAIRNMKPESPDLITRLLVRWPVGLYASRQYLDRHGEPRPGEGFAGHDLVFYEPHLASSHAPTLVGEPIHAGRLVSGVNSSLMLRTMIRTGMAIGEVPTALAERDGLVRVWPERERTGGYEVWLVTHQDLRNTARVRAVIDVVVEAFQRTR
ncbi:LysR family transcriptional regulator [Cupriavidus sp. CV2]|uniref:LysR family transcriptional regulator n=1 Tax=Cupriavidus ulmosensis TaxID=3065913 RepID=UPI00296B4C50|nr:LysR family transcriptional regulator [Cupriavidus sp. CV2]MDW3685331.1 LysR family transcriptional regulator [Cupriavidus sp. CV2]